jgi:hypothetical protein
MNPCTCQSPSHSNPCPSFGNIDQMAFPASTWEHVRVAEYAWEPFQQGHHGLWQGQVRRRPAFDKRPYLRQAEHFPDGCYDTISCIWRSLTNTLV